MAQISFLVEETPQGGYKAYTKKPPIDVQANTWDELKMAIQEAINHLFEEGNRPVAISLNFVREGIPTG